MNTYAYEAVNSTGLPCNGVLEVASQSEALQRIKEMGLFPTRVAPRRPDKKSLATAKRPTRTRNAKKSIVLFGSGVKTTSVTAFTRQLATLIDAGMPLLRGLQILQQQESNSVLKRIIGEISVSIEGGSSLSEALAAHPKVFNRLYVSMVQAGEAAGVLEVTLRRLAEFQEKAQKIRGKVKSAMFYPFAVMTVAIGVMAIMMIFVIPRFQSVFEGLTGGRPMPAFTVFVLKISDVLRQNALAVSIGIVASWIALMLVVRTSWGRQIVDQIKLSLPVIGKILRASAISRFARTLGTLLSSGVPVLQALTIVRETAGNVVLGNVISSVHSCVKEGESITTPLRMSRVFPPMVVGMVDVGEQTGALPDLLMKVADECDERVDNAVSSMMSLLEPVMIVSLAVIVGSLVIAMFLPILDIMNNPSMTGPSSGE